jgi:hypothetical protein
MHEIEKQKWDEEQIARAARIMLHAEKNKHWLIKVLDEIVHWMVLLLVILGNIIICTALVFISKFAKELYLYLVAAIFALCFGMLIEMPMREIERLDKHKHLFSRFMLPFLAILNIFILIGVKNSIESLTKKTFSINPVAAGIIYGLFFVMPHLLFWAAKKKK